jgi:hypothetical protein
MRAGRGRLSGYPRSGRARRAGGAAGAAPASVPGGELAGRVHRQWLAGERRKAADRALAARTSGRRALPRRGPTLTAARPVVTTAWPVVTTARPVVTTARPVMTAARPVVAAAWPVGARLTPAVVAGRKHRRLAASGGLALAGRRARPVAARRAAAMAAPAAARLIRGVVGRVAHSASVSLSGGALAW